MNIKEKLEILSDAAKYDASCSSSGSSRGSSGGLGSASSSGICHSWTADGRCVSLLKILLTNYCIYDCSYCCNRRTNKVRRAAFTVDEIVDLTISFYRRNYIEGLFLSSGIIKDEDTTQGLIMRVVKKLRLEHGFRGYIHTKAIPGASRELIRETGRYSDRLSVNIELPSEKSLKLLAPEKNRENILKPIKYIGEEYEHYQLERSKKKRVPEFAPAGHTSQLIVGASPESDRQILNLAENLYNRMSLKRVYYSAYMPVNNSENLPALSTKPPLLREHRLYQADWLMRLYGFEAREILDERDPFLKEEYDPKVGWTLNNLDLFPVEITRASYELLLRVPGIGIKGAKRIVHYRRDTVLNFESLKKMGIVLKRAKYFITINGRYMDSYILDKDILIGRLSDKRSSQLQLF
ncbi:putative DNA modification/repair radical SAM protein [Propionigenium maris DSM 9537]|uniref:DNA modification/repair radical SAM protein n=1 Tax=Propionigenium maris DSM 9537 TaxID=1123000 RepID=A0A9W6LMS8_9FUSO|nr:putative DNA modification/repair radical SAM protein [Propionigenium maris]GLI56134.1 putative DNA modification/repair radical SAM protein [Propionigenium maris DSM 9537]